MSFVGYIVYRVTNICCVFALIMNQETNCSNTCIKYDLIDAETSFVEMFLK